MAVEHLLVRELGADKGTNKKFIVKALSRSVAEALDGVEARGLELVAALFEGVDVSDSDPDAPDTPEQRKAAIDLAHKSPAFRDDRVRLQCDRLSALTEPLEDGTELGDLMTARWEADDVTEAQIDKYVEDASEKAAKRPL